MSRVSTAVNERCVQLGFDVFAGTLSVKVAVDELAQAGMNSRSAKITMEVIRYMAEGKGYTRGLSASQTEYALTVFRNKMDDSLFQNALTALEGHILYYEQKRSVTLHALRQVLHKFKGKSSEMPTLEFLRTQAAADLAAALTLSSKDRQSRLPQSGHKPQRVTATTATFQRNPYVIAEVLHRAGGQCGHCNAPAPFTKHSDQTPYLEVHHRVPLAENGDDTVENAIALCPNCHREAHHGVNRSKFKPAPHNV